MPSKGKTNENPKSRGAKAPRVPVTGGWTDAHGMGFNPKNSDSKPIQSRLRPRVTKYVTNATGSKAHPQPEITQAEQLEVNHEHDGHSRVENGLNQEVQLVESEKGTSGPQGRPQRVTRASQKVSIEVKATPNSKEDVQKGTEVEVTTTINNEEGPRGTKRKRTTRITIAVSGRTPYEVYTRVSWKTTPYPDFHGPSSEACEKVCALLKEQHGHCPRPQEIPPPSLDIAGCGQVRQVIDAIIRTLISANTTFENADKAIKRLHETFGTVTENLQLDADEYPGLHHCLDYNRIRSASLKDVAKAVEPSGSHFKKAGFIKAILDGTYTINAERAEAFRNETSANPATILAADKLSDKQKQFEIWMFDNGILHLEHYRALSNPDAMNELVSWNGIAVKTAACVLLFCMQQPVFALDTHCLRLTNWLGWTPHDANPDEAFAHLDALVPDDLKYPLHQLFIRHGQVCLRCKKESNVGSAGWDECVCLLEDLLKRSGKEKPPPKTKALKPKMAEDVQKEEVDTQVTSPKKRAHQVKEEEHTDDDDYNETPKKRGRKPKKAAKEVPHKRQLRSQNSVNKGTSQEEGLKGAGPELADVATAEAMLKPAKHDEIVVKMEADEGSSELSEHSDTEFMEQ